MVRRTALPEPHSAWPHSWLDEIGSALLGVRGLGDVRRVVLPLLRRCLGLTAVAVRLPPSSLVGPDEIWLSCPEQDEAAFGGLAIDLPGLGGRLFFAPDRAEIGQVARLLDTCLAHAAEFEALYRFAVTDSLTGLYNRRFFVEALERELCSSRRHERALALLAIDLDGFKAVNDGAGHPIGDRVLVQVARVLRVSTRRGDVVARVGGDEFAVLATSADERRARRLAERILQGLLRLPAPLGLAISASIGIAVAPAWPGDSAELVDRADRAMYAAKRSGKGCIGVWSD